MTVTRGSGESQRPAMEDAEGTRQPVFVVGVDGSAAAVAALEWALEQAQLSGGRVVALAVSEPPPVLAGDLGIVGGVMVPQLIEGEEMAAVAEQWLTDAIAALPVGTVRAVERHVVHGDAATVLLDAARDADLLVLGNHGRGALASALLGSVAQRCAHHVVCPLVLIPAPKTSQTAGDS
ncbi:universal stress protein [Pseudonocardia alaniniphila]|uniref:Universal stress protein n=1 Tax=Pseudonocardia alaniniphila TaxID=75291 RepID=A0ABS9TTZ9_9PSEU|nr:universal stress protein [Pseudonocardia alaniniphila]MCH6171696.1 universal stress protein [Pseudonocardia alaniniphila]